MQKLHSHIIRHYSKRLASSCKNIQLPYISTRAWPAGHDETTKKSNTTGEQCTYFWRYMPLGFISVYRLQVKPSMLDPIINCNFDIGYPSGLKWHFQSALRREGWIYHNFLASFSYNQVFLTSKLCNRDLCLRGVSNLYR